MDGWMDGYIVYWDHFNDHHHDNTKRKLHSQMTINSAAECEWTNFWFTAVLMCWHVASSSEYMEGWNASALYFRKRCSACYLFSSSALLQHITAMLECSMSAVVTLLVTEPVGSLSIRSCRVQMLSDWYTMLYNPSPDYINTLHCTQEAVYPL